MYALGKISVGNIVKGHKVNGDAFGKGHMLLPQSNKVRVFHTQFSVSPTITESIAQILYVKFFV